VNDPAVNLFADGSLFSGVGASIGKITVKNKAGDSFINSIIAAYQIGKAKLLDIQTESEDDSGIVADFVGSFRSSDARLVRVDEPGVYAKKDRFSVRVV